MYNMLERCVVVPLNGPHGCKEKTTKFMFIGPGVMHTPPIMAFCEKHWRPGMYDHPLISKEEAIAFMILEEPRDVGSR